jgi:hypothetical protein
MNLAAMDFNAGAEAEAMGFGGMKHLFFEQRAPGGRTENEASISFAGARTGIASWLAAPRLPGRRSTPRRTRSSSCRPPPAIRGRLLMN